MVILLGRSTENKLDAYEEALNVVAALPRSLEVKTLGRGAFGPGLRGASWMDPAGVASLVRPRDGGGLKNFMPFEHSNECRLLISGSAFKAGIELNSFSVLRIKVIKQIDLSVLSPAALEESHKEVGVLRQLSHRHIVAYYVPSLEIPRESVPEDTFVQSNSLYIVMEYADGGDLASLIRQHKDSETPFTEAEAMTIFGQCLLALHYIHSKRILHRNLAEEAFER